MITRGSLRANAQLAPPPTVTSTSAIPIAPQTGPGLQSPRRRLRWVPGKQLLTLRLSPDRLGEAIGDGIRIVVKRQRDRAPRTCFGKLELPEPLCRLSAAVARDEQPQRIFTFCCLRLAVGSVGEENTSPIRPRKQCVFDLPRGIDPIVFTAVQPIRRHLACTVLNVGLLTLGRSARLNVPLPRTRNHLTSELSVYGIRLVRLALQW